MKTDRSVKRYQEKLKGVLYAILLLNAGLSSAQQTYDTFDGERYVSYFTPKNWGKLDTLAANPAADSVNQSSRCASYKRSRQRYDYIKLYPSVKFADVEQYATYDDNAPKFKMKVYSTAPVGSLIEIQMGKKTGNAYPEGTHSQYQAFTKTTNQWEVVEFKYSQTPRGSETKSKDVDQMTLLFMPGTNSTYVFYFDELTGPSLLGEQSAKTSRKKTRLFN